MKPNQPGTNSGHGHVWPRPDGAWAPECREKPAGCEQCAADAAEYYRVTGRVAVGQWYLTFVFYCPACGKKVAAGLRHSLVGGNRMTTIVACPGCLAEYDVTALLEQGPVVTRREKRRGRPHTVLGTQG